jgi:hypothetical protein
MLCCICHSSFSCTVAMLCSASCLLLKSGVVATHCTQDPEDAACYFNCQCVCLAVCLHCSCQLLAVTAPVTA